MPREAARSQKSAEFLGLMELAKKGITRLVDLQQMAVA